MAKSDNEQRERRILDAAAELFSHYGYDKTTVDDIAREAGISKGAIYLHFNSKDDLLESLLVREIMTYQKTWLERLAADPQGGTIGGMYKNVLYALSSSPFMAAMFRQDKRVLGNYLRKPDNLFRQQNQGTRYEFVRMMQDAGAMRPDIDAKVVAHIMNMLAYGLVAMDEIIPPEFIPPTDDVIEGIAQIMDRALTPADGGNREAGIAIVRQLSEAGLQAFEQSKQENQE